MGEIIVRERMFVPVHLVDEKKVLKRYRHRFYEEHACRKCPNLRERHNYVCNKCEFYLGQNNTVSRLIVDDIEYFGFPLGDRKEIAKTFDIVPSELGVVDLRTRAKRRYPVKMVDFNPYDYQTPAVKKLGKQGFGVLKAPPRSGKTPTMLYTGITQWKYRIAIIADQKEFLEQFLDHVEEFTNLPELQEKAKKKLFGFGKKPQDFEDFEIIVCTYQTFLSDKGKDLFKLLNKNFGTVFIDEVHSSAALEYSKVINNLRSRIRIGATGTDDRKDCLVAGTLVVTRSGLVPIEDIQVGDHVLSFNHDLNCAEFEEVIEHHLREKTSTVTVEYEGGSIQCTPDHEFWTQRGYVKACELTTEDTLLAYEPDAE